jgi:peptidoglycan/LPS O-acetylase OafA/YrhL
MDLCKFGVCGVCRWVRLPPRPDLDLAMPALFGSPLATLERIDSWKAQLFLFYHGCLFALGVYLWLLMFKGVTLRRLSIACVCFVGGFIEILHTAQHHASEVGMDLPRAPPVAIWAAFMVLIIASIAMNNRVQALAGRLAPAVRMLGLMTYPLYLVHQTVGSALIRTLHNLGMPRFLALLLGAAACLFISWIVAAALEPLLKQRLRTALAGMGAWLGRQERMAFLFRATTPVCDLSPTAPATRS